MYLLTSIFFLVLLIVYLLARLPLLAKSRDQLAK